MYIYETDKNIWTEININWGTPRWNHSCLIVPALPKSKLFLFGGSSAYFDEGSPWDFGSICNNVVYIDLTDDLEN